MSVNGRVSKYVAVHGTVLEGPRAHSYTALIGSKVPCDPQKCGSHEWNRPQPLHPAFLLLTPVLGSTSRSTVYIYIYIYKVRNDSVN